MSLSKKEIMEMNRKWKDYRLEELNEGGGAEGMINRIIKDVEKYKIKYLKQAVRKGDWHEIQELGHDLQNYGKQLIKWGIKAGK